MDGLGLVLAAVSLVGQQASSPAASRGSVTVVWVGHAPEKAQAEVARLYRGRLDLEQIVAGDGVVEPDRAVRVVVTRTNRPRFAPAGALGATDARTRAVIVWGNEIERFSGWTFGESRGEVALGRVVAHEIMHALYPEKGHWGNGLMRGYGRDGHVKADELVRPGVELE